MIYNIDLGDQHDKWQKYKADEGIILDSEFLRLLLELYENTKQTRNSEPGGRSNECSDESKTSHGEMLSVESIKTECRAEYESSLDGIIEQPTSKITPATVVTSNSNKSTKPVSGSDDQSELTPILDLLRGKKTITPTYDDYYESSGSDYEGTSFNLGDNHDNDETLFSLDSVPKRSMLLDDTHGEVESSSVMHTEADDVGSSSALSEEEAEGEDVDKVSKDGAIDTRDKTQKKMLPNINELPPGTMVCMICRHWYTSVKTIMQKHMCEKHNMIPEEGCYKCVICSHYYFSKKSFHNHMYRKHDGANEVYEKCEECGESVRWSEVDKHKFLVHHTKGKPTVICEKCGKAFSCQSSLKKHHETHDEQSWPCPYDNCEIVSTTRHGLGLHIRNRHEKKGKCETCEICGKSFTRRAHLRVHMRQHSGAHPFSCEFCDYTAKQKVLVRLHMKSKHAGFIATK